MKKNLWMIAPIIAVVIMIIATLFALPKSKVTGGYDDVLTINNIEVKIISTQLVQEEGVIFVEMLTSITNRSGNELKITNDNFDFSSEKPTQTINLSIPKNQKVNVRQLYSYSGIISHYKVNVLGKVLSFDFTIKNNELARKNIELKSQLKENFDESLKKQQEAATTVRVQEEEKTTKENQEVVKTAETHKVAYDKETQEDKEIKTIMGTYFSQSIQDTSSILINGDYTAKVMVDCEKEKGELVIDKLHKTFSNNKTVFTGEYQSEKLGSGTIVFSYINDHILVLGSPIQCLIGISYAKQ